MYYGAEVKFNSRVVPKLVHLYRCQARYVLEITVYWDAKFFWDGPSRLYAGG